MYLLQCSHYKQCLVHERRSVGLDITYTLFQYRVATQKFPKQRSLVPEAKSSQCYRLYRKDGCGQCDVIHWFLSPSWHFSKCHVIYLFLFLELNINILDTLSLTKLRANSEKANGSTTRVEIGQQLPRINKNEQTKTKALKNKQTGGYMLTVLNFFHILWLIVTCGDYMVAQSLIALHTFATFNCDFTGCLKGNNLSAIAPETFFNECRHNSNM